MSERSNLSEDTATGPHDAESGAGPGAEGLAATGIQSLWRRRVIKLMRRAGVVLVAAAVAVGVAAVPASAHMIATPYTAETKFFHTAFLVTHGCAGSATTAVRMQIPDGVHLVTPDSVPGWELQVTRAAGEGEGFGRIVEVAWVGGPLPDHEQKPFGLGFRIDEEAPEILWFPTVQECEVGENRWVTIPPSLAEWH
ncbi:YcnI family protein, partial [Micromonospora yasonensis]|uniref:YcnI family protein n=1 Tax=Micromonospora yasonensis TaxID=1128667 RepID=UPI00222F082C